MEVAATPVIIQKCAVDGSVVRTYTGTVVQRAPHAMVIAAQWQDADRDLGYTVFNTGDRFTEYFYADQPFNIMQVEGAEIKGWYCNISRPAVLERELIAYIDLYLDLWVTPNGAMLVLDEDEFDAADLDAATRQLARAALTTLQQWVRTRSGPFASCEPAH